MLFDEHGNPWPRFVPEPRPACVKDHHNPKQLFVTGTDNRGYERCVCKTCRRFIGFRDPKGLTRKGEIQDV